MSRRISGVIRTRCEIRRGASDQRQRSRDAARTYHEPCCWSEPDYEGVKASGYDPVRNRILIKIRAVMARIFPYSGRHAKILLEFTDKGPFFDDLSVSKTHFTDKPAFFSDLSVNF